jgi:hypothetical protein
MPKAEVHINALQRYLPEGSYAPVREYLDRYKVQLTITRERQTLLGDYRRPSGANSHRISVNGNLNVYSFLITLIHELAHLLAFEQYGRRIEPHGKEWQQVYAGMLVVFLQLNIFPEDIVTVLNRSLKRPAASTCAETHLTRVLAKYDQHEDGLLFVEELKEGQHFAIKGGRVFRRGEKRRTRFFCAEIATGRIFLFSGVYRVKLVAG